MSGQPLTDAEFERLADALKRYGGKRAMNIEMLDGFLAALICSPKTVLPSEYYLKFGEMMTRTNCLSRTIRPLRSSFL